MDISIITPYYKGKKFLNQYTNMLQLALNKLHDLYSYEVIIINDSPDEKVEIDSNVSKSLNIKIIDNVCNQGIHKSRINGVKNAKGRFILFLDQDDEITENSLKILLESIENYDICIGNGYYEFDTTRELIFSNKLSGNFSIHKLFYLYVKNFIISPGQCLIKKESIPKDWTSNPLSNNGSDDFFLWLLLFNQSAKFKYVHEIVYIHKYTGENFSIQADKMFESNKELLKTLDKCSYSKSDISKLKSSIYYKYYYKNNFVKETFKHFDVFLVNVFYRLIWRGCIVTQKKLMKGK